MVNSTLCAAVVVAGAGVIVGLTTRALRRELRVNRAALDALGELGAANRALVDEVTRHRNLTGRVGDTVDPKGRS